MDIECIAKEKQNGTCAMPEELAQILRKERYAMGTGGVKDFLTLPAADLWIAKDDVRPIGFGWLVEHTSAYVPNGLHASVAVIESKRGCGVGSRLMDCMEAYVKNLGQSAIHAQVNGNHTDSGLRTCKWLVRRGYSVVKSTLDELYTTMSESWLIENSVFPLYFSKDLR